MAEASTRILTASTAAAPETPSQGENARAGNAVATRRNAKRRLRAAGACRAPKIWNSPIHNLAGFAPNSQLFMLLAIISILAAAKSLAALGRQRKKFSRVFSK